jgi:hypothetical protein
MAASSARLGSISPNQIGAQVCATARAVHRAFAGLLPAFDQAVLLETFRSLEVAVQLDHTKALVFALSVSRITG